MTKSLEERTVALERIDTALKGLKKLREDFGDFTAPSLEASEAFRKTLGTAIAEGHKLRRKYIRGGGGSDG